MSRASRSDGAITRARILEAAGTLIAKQGYAQTTNKQIASAAEVDLAAINYHFNGREGLYLAVLSEAHRHYLDGAELTALAESAMAPEEKLEALLEMNISRLNEQEGWYGRLYTQELLSPSPLFNDFLQSEGMSKRQTLLRIVSQITGLAEEDPRVMLHFLSIIGPCVMLMMTGKFTSSTINGIADSMDSRDLVAHFKQFSLAGIKGCARDD